MTNILEQILPQEAQSEVKKLHIAIENKTFLKRYMNRVVNSPLALLDHYRHICQLKCIYDAFAKQLTSKECMPKLPESLNCLLERANKIEDDLAFLGQYVNDADKNRILDSTNKYVNYLNNIKVTHGIPSSELLIHFLVSILGDLNGGQFLKNIVKKMYEKNGMYSAEQPNQGLTFYSFAPNTAANLTEWLKTFITFRNPKDEYYQPLTNDDPDARLLGKGAIDAFNMQSSIIDDLESTRASTAEFNKTSQKTTVAQNASSFFSCSNTTKAALVLGLAVSAGVAITNTLNRLGS
jgi:heme oxygenase